MVEHWEVAVKFYLQHSRHEKWSSWIGPGQRDRLDLKLGRMIDHQLPLSKTQAGMDTLAKLKIGEAKVRRAFVKGIFFHSWNQLSDGPRDKHPKSKMGVWIPVGELPQYIEQIEPSRWLVRQKPDWLCPALCAADESLSTDQLLNLEIKRPKMLSRLKLTSEQDYFEDARLFVVPDHWQASYAPPEGES